MEYGPGGRTGWRVGGSARGNAPRGDRKPDRMLRSLLSPSQSSGLRFPFECHRATRTARGPDPTYPIPPG
jgi:hypothetical protein